MNAHEKLCGYWYLNWRACLVNAYGALQRGLFADAAAYSRAAALAQARYLMFHAQEDR